MNDRPLRIDYSAILERVRPGSSVIDLGCGDGELLALLKARNNCTVRGVEIDDGNIVACIQKGLSVFQGDIDDGLDDYQDGSFDYVILNQSLQVVLHPDEVLTEMLRLGRRAIVSFPNFGFWRIRLDLMLHGHAPRTPSLPYEWYNTPNLRIIALQDFKDLVAAKHYRTEWSTGITGSLEAGRRIHGPFLNLRSEYALFEISSGTA